MTNLSERALGCMFGAAYGDSLGAAVEFMDREAIIGKYGKDGISEPDGFMGFPPGSVTDDTQQALALGNGLLSAAIVGVTDGIIRENVWEQLRKWSESQKYEQHRRAPGTNSLMSLDHEHPGTHERPHNYSDSCGAVMRVHPVGLLFSGDPERAFAVGKLTAELTHGGAETQLAAGVLSAVVSMLFTDGGLDTAIRSVVDTLPESRTRDLAGQALLLPVQGDVWENVRKLGRGWRGDEALAIGLYAARCGAEDPEFGFNAAVNHSGDSDSTGSIAGAVMGASGGLAVVPREWRGRLEHNRELSTVATTLLECRVQAAV